MIKHLVSGLNVAPAVAQLAANPQVWDTHKLRTNRYGTPHGQVSDIWVRYNDWGNFSGDVAKFVMEPHESVWYPVADALTEIRHLVSQVMALVSGEELGGVLITRVPPGGEVAPHIDQGWHAQYYDKYAVQLKGNKNQVFWFEDCELRPEPGDLYTFDNSRLHAVYNHSDEERITLIICIRGRKMIADHERVAFDMYFASVCSMQYHPGAGTKEHRRLTLGECRDVAMDMLKIRRNSINGQEG